MTTPKMVFDAMTRATDATAATPAAELPALTPGAARLLAGVAAEIGRPAFSHSSGAPVQAGDADALPDEVEDALNDALDALGAPEGNGEE